MKEINIPPKILWGKLEGVQRIIEKIAPTDIPILIEGETGTGKRLVAKVIHALSSRRGQPFIPINCAAIPDGLLTTDIFRQIADRGTAFLDEVGDLNMEKQARLLSMLEENDSRSYRGSDGVKIDIRLIAATRKNLERDMISNMFSQRLFFRLCVFKIKLSALRERIDDVIPLAEHFMAGRAKKISPRAKKLLKTYLWPGNVRELKNCIDRAVILGDGKIIQPQDFPHAIRLCGKIIPAPPESLDRSEEEKKTLHLYEN